MRQRCRWKIYIFFIAYYVTPAFSNEDDSQYNKRGYRPFFSPRMDYDQWRPLGRGDPLKNDPTFDYVPPVLDNVQYWVDSNARSSSSEESRTTNGQKTEMLLLGVPSKKPAIQTLENVAQSRHDNIYESEPKYQDKTFNVNQKNSQPNFLSSMTSQILPTIMSFANRILDKTINSKGEYIKPPYSVLTPPQLVTRPPENHFSAPSLRFPISQKPVLPNQFLSSKPFNRNTRPNNVNGVTVLPSNLIYQSSSVGSHKEFESVPSINWQLPSTTEQHKFKFNDQKLSLPNTVARIQFSSKNNLSNSILDASNSNHNFNFVTPPSLDENEMMFKGHISDDNDISNSYVKIDKPEAQMHHVGIETSNVASMPSFYSLASKNSPLMNSKTIHNMEMMKQSMDVLKPSPASAVTDYSKPNFLANLLQKEKTSFENANFIGSSSSVSNAIITNPNVKPSSEVPSSAGIMATNPMAFSPVSFVSDSTQKAIPESSTMVSILTTDPLFKHYKQPVEQVTGPAYVIIQGHSKVKTYKPTKQRNGILVEESNSIPYILEKKYDYKIKHLHGFENKKDLLDISDKISQNRQARAGNLHTLKHIVETGYGAINIQDTDIDRKDHDVQEAELSAKYKVHDGEYDVMEEYHKGTVEEIDTDID
ncbi:uncharacterized protein LOC115874914 [Sitophilus oryzae]|uniref:Uncharacterized protein LOC115874914 n=1 Tax=Sitophilus oryzae TaxID=7048 RepID=A0A6J2X4I0_SITOR|nr:uncharacterized protein LOC115874914 [Sitophilus oryzae]